MLLSGLTAWMEAVKGTISLCHFWTRLPLTLKFSGIEAEARVMPVWVSANFLVTIRIPGVCGADCVGAAEVPA